MLPKSRRLVSSDFRFFSSARSFQSPHLSVRVKRNNSGLPARAAAVAGAALAKRANERNLLRRRLYTVLKEALPSFPRGAMVFVSAKKGAGGIPFAALRLELLGILSSPSVRQYLSAY